MAVPLQLVELEAKKRWPAQMSIAVRAVALALGLAGAMQAIVTQACMGRRWLSMAAK
jgi:hypothetical protein